MHLRMYMYKLPLASCILTNLNGHHIHVYGDNKFVTFKEL